jgi:hypothetical protein
MYVLSYVVYSLLLDNILGLFVAFFLVWLLAVVFISSLVFA